MKNKAEILSLFHHIHHIKDIHDVHHCGGKHVSVDSDVDYKISHCGCGKHQINKEIAIGHATDNNLYPIKIKINFLEKCPFEGWHVESGVKIIDELKNLHHTTLSM